MHTEEGAVPQTGDLCGGTGGIGKITGLGDGGFTIARNDNGIIQRVRLSTQASIETPKGYGSEADLKIGDRVTLVGGPNPDGSFSADTVVVCSGTSTASAARTPQEGNPAYARVQGVVDIAIPLFLIVLWLGTTAFLRIKRKKSFVYLLFFTIFYIYIVTVLDYTLFQFQSLIVLKQFVPNLMLNGETAGESLNLIPLVTLTPADVRTSLLNILLMMPFGFGLPFVSNLRMKKVVIAGALFSVGIECMQLLSGLLAGITFRVADINDVMFNTVGVMIGYLLFVVFIRIYRPLVRPWRMRNNPIVRYIAERPQVE